MLALLREVFPVPRPLYSGWEVKRSLVWPGMSCHYLSTQSRAKAAGKKHPKRRGQRATSNIFAMFDQAQIQEFKEVSASLDRKSVV